MGYISSTTKQREPATMSALKTLPTDQMIRGVVEQVLRVPSAMLRATRHGSKHAKALKPYASIR